MYFYIEVELFKTETVDNIYGQADEIYRKFLSDQAEYQVNIDSDTLKSLRERLLFNNVDRNLFDAAQKSVFKLMETACITGFEKLQGRQTCFSTLADSKSEEVPSASNKVLKRSPSLLSKLLKKGSHRTVAQPRTISTVRLSKYFERQSITAE